MSEHLCSRRAPRLPLPASVCLLQGPEHPNPGKPFTARGFPRQCYLPDNAQGRKVKARPTPLGVAPPSPRLAALGPAVCVQWEAVGWGGPSSAATPDLPLFTLLRQAEGDEAWGPAGVWATPSWGPAVR